GFRRTSLSPFSFCRLEFSRETATMAHIKATLGLLLVYAATKSFAMGPASYDRGIEGLTDGFLKQVMSRIHGSGLDLSDGSLEFMDRNTVEPPPDVYPRDPSYSRHQGRYRKEGQQQDILGGPSLRDQEYLQHSSLWGHQYVAGEWTAREPVD
ncbi:unnamed protein product, partial [Ixodes pacificus]